MDTDKIINKCNEYLFSDYTLDPEWREMVSEYKQFKIAESENRLYIFPKPTTIEDIETLKNIGRILNNAEEMSRLLNE